MSELILVKIPVHVEANSSRPAVDAERVIGIVGDQSPTMLEYGYKPDGSELEEAIEFPGLMPERIADFYDQTLALPHEKRPFYDCHLFAFYALGKARKIQFHQDLRIRGLDPILANSFLDAGASYATTVLDGTINHSVLGIGRSTYNISVIGMGMPLLLGSSANMLKLYGAQRLNYMHVDKAIE